MEIQVLKMTVFAILEMLKNYNKYQKKRQKTLIFIQKTTGRIFLLILLR